VTPYNKFNATDRGHGIQPEEQKKGNGRKPLRCWTCCGEHCWSECPLHQGSRTHIYSAQEAHTIAYVGQSILRIYEAVDNRQVDHQTSIIEIEGKLHDQVVSNLIDLGTNYSYISLNLMDECSMNKEVHAESWLVQLETWTKKKIHH